MLSTNKESDFLSEGLKQAGWSAALLVGSLASFSFTGCSTASPAKPGAVSTSAAPTQVESYLNTLS